MRATIENFKDILNKISPEDAAQLAEHSIDNHHADGLFYLCLKRTPEQTLKIYYVPEVVNPNSGYLVNPHNHRYNFNSVVLAGELRHLRFNIRQHAQRNSNAECHKWDWETKQMRFDNFTEMYPIKIERHTKGSSYYVHTSEVHTIIINQPTIIGLVQEADSCDDARLFLPDYNRSFAVPKSKQMAVETYMNYLAKIKELI